MTKRRIIDYMAKRASDGVLRLRASDVANSIACAPSTVQHYGRKGLTHHKWAFLYDRGWFALRQREDWSPPPEPVPPEWFELPTGLVAEDRHSGFDIGQRRVLAYRFVQDCIEGRIALAPWQRAEVWTEQQQVDLLDSMMRGISIGALTMWYRSRDESVEDARPIPGCDRPQHGYMGAHLIVDGQQRATTLVRSALGHLDDWCWNGLEWTRGKGFLTPRIAVMGAMNLPNEERKDWADTLLDHPIEQQARLAFAQAEKIARTDLDLMVLGGTSSEMIETYRRLATHGSPHSPEDLALMERWASENDSDR